MEIEFFVKNGQQKSRSKPTGGIMSRAWTNGGRPRGLGSMDADLAVLEVWMPTSRSWKYGGRLLSQKLPTKVAVIAHRRHHIAVLDQGQDVKQSLRPTSRYWSDAVASGFDQFRCLKAPQIFFGILYGIQRQIDIEPVNDELRDLSKKQHSVF